MWKVPKHKKKQKKYINILTSLNVSVTVISLCVAGFGVLLKVGSNVFLPYIERFTERISKQLMSAGLYDTHLSNLDLIELSQTFALPLIAIGICSALLAACGTVVAKTKKVMLIIPYSGFITLGLLLQSACLFVLIAYRKLIDGHLRSYLLAGLQENYRGYNETNLISQTWNIVMVTLHCCGVNDYTDFKRALQWRRNLFQDGWWFELKTPLTCCILEKKDPGDFACAVNPVGQTSYYMQGCYSAFWTLFDSNRGYPLAGFICLMLVQVVLVMTSIMLVREVRKRPKKEAETTQQIEYCPNEESNPNEDGNQNKDRTRNGLSALNNGLLQHLSFLGLNMERSKDVFSQHQSNGRRYSVSPDFLSQLFSGTRRLSQMQPCEFDGPQGRMPSFDFGVPRGRMPSFDFLSNPVPSFDFGCSQGPVIVQLPQQSTTQHSALKAITEVPDSGLDESEPKIRTSTPKVTEMKENVPKFERC